MLHAGASTNYILISIFKYLLVSLQVKNYKQLQIYENEHFQIEYRSTLNYVYFRSGIMVYSNTCNLLSHYLQFSI